MQISKQKVNVVLEKQLFAMLWQLVTDFEKSERDGDRTVRLIVCYRIRDGSQKTGGCVLAI